MQTTALPFPVRVMAFVGALLLVVITVGAQSSAEKRIVHQITEQADDGNQPVTRDTRRVDVNSTLIVSFQALTNQPAGDPTPEWVIMTNVLAQVERQMNELVEIMVQVRTVDLNNSTEVQRIKDLHKQFILRAADYPDQWQAALGKSDTEMAQITSGAAMPGRPIVKSQPYVNFAAWLRWRVETLKGQARGLIQSNTVLVAVQAFHKPFDGPMKAVHVDGYDHISSGDSQPIDKKGLRMTPAEQRRFAADVQANEKAAESIREVAKDASGFAERVRADLVRLRESLSNLEPQLRRALTNWDAEIIETPLGRQLQDWSTNNAVPPDARAAAAAILQDLQGFQRDLLAVQDVYRSVRFLKATVGGSTTGSLSGLLFGPDGVLGDITSLTDKLSKLRDAITGWGDRFGRLQQNLPKLGGRLTPEQLASLLPKELSDISAEFKTSFPKTIELLAELRKLWNDTGDQMVASEVLAGTDLDPIWRGDFELADGTLDLTTIGLTEGESVVVKVKYREAGTNGVPGRVLPEETYKLETLMMGLHRKFGASLIFARGLRGDSEEQDWKPNVAAHVHWFYRYRHETSSWRKTWNYVNPGLGIHLASLDQGDDAVELGTGANLSFFDGLLTGGFGVNLNNNERPYVFIGLSLLDALEKAKSLKK